MPDKNIQPKDLCWLTGNLYEDKDVSAALDSYNTRVVKVVEEEEEDEEWGQRWRVESPAGTFVVSEQDLSPMPTLNPDTTNRGFGLMEFQDLYGSSCSIQESSLATEGALWFGINTRGHFTMRPPYNADPNDPDTDTGGRMHLSQGQAAALLPLLEHFVKTGALPTKRLFPGEEEE